ncbi:hypothetical protein PLICRDRAFT_181864 [Plicaturopsis crispa FD-325 SS-3]|nr:hypothetical protein PLICRDRAFT_181864 [Plicaturopsis crispa FD-325 SS-3]
MSLYARGCVSARSGTCLHTRGHVSVCSRTCLCTLGDMSLYTRGHVSARSRTCLCTLGDVSLCAHGHACACKNASLCMRRHVLEHLQGHVERMRGPVLKHTQRQHTMARRRASTSSRGWCSVQLRRCARTHVPFQPVSCSCTLSHRSRARSLSHVCAQPASVRSARLLRGLDRYPSALTQPVSRSRTQPVSVSCSARVRVLLPHSIRARLYSRSQCLGRALVISHTRAQAVVHTPPVPCPRSASVPCTLNHYLVRTRPISRALPALSPSRSRTQAQRCSAAVQGLIIDETLFRSDLDSHPPVQSVFESSTAGPPFTILIVTDTNSVPTLFRNLAPRMYVQHRRRTWAAQCRVRGWCVCEGGAVKGFCRRRSGRNIGAIVLSCASETCARRRVESSRETCACRDRTEGS